MNTTRVDSLLANIPSGVAKFHVLATAIELTSDNNTPWVDSLLANAPSGVSKFVAKFDKFHTLWVVKLRFCKNGMLQFKKPN